MFFQPIEENVAAYDLTSIPGYSHAAVHDVLNRISREMETGKCST